MIVKVNKNYRIRSDSKQWITERRVKVKDKTIWRGLGYYINFASAISGLSEYRIRKIDDKLTVNQILEALKHIRQDAEKVCMEFNVRAVQSV